MNIGEYQTQYFEDFTIGEKWESKERIVSEKDIADFAVLTGDLNKIHTDEEYAKKSIFKGIVAHGLFSLSITLGLWYSLGITNETVIAIVEVSHARFLAPVYPQDSLRLYSEVISKRESKSRRGVGLVTWSDRLVNAKTGIVVLESERTFMVKRKS